MSEKEHIEDVPHGTAKEQEVLEAVRSSFLDRQFDSNWRPAKVQLITNDTLFDEYEEKKQDFLIRGRKGDELVEHCGFFVENNVAILEFLTRLGLQARDSEYNALGYNRMGVYLSKHADVCLQHALVKHSGSLVMRMVVCKYIAGRSTTAIPRVASAAEFIEPTQGFDSHESVINPDPRDSLQNKFDRSQVYLYEINKLLQPCSRPRQALPFAVVSFTQNGAYLPAIDAEATAAERMASSIAQQNIANIINSKETLAAQPGASAATAPTVATIPTAAMPNPGPGLMPGPPVAGSPQLPAGSVTLPGPQIIPAGLQVQTSSTPSVIAASVMSSPPVQNGINGESPSPGGTTNIEDQNRDPLKNVVSQLNVKLGTEIKKPTGQESVHIVSMAPPAVPTPHAPTTVVSASPHLGPLPAVPQFAGISGIPRFLHAANGLPPGMLPQQFLQGGVVPGGATGFPGVLPAGLIQGIPGQPGLIPGQPGLLPSPHHQMMLPMAAPSPVVKPGLPGSPYTLIPANLPGASTIPGMAGMPGMPGMQGMAAYPGAGLMGSVPGAMGSIPGAMGTIPGTIQGTLPGQLPGALPQTRSPSGQQLGQSRAITPEVPTAGYVANNVSGYTPAIYGAGPGSLGQPIPVLTNGTVQSSTQSSLSQQVSASQAAAVASIAGMSHVGMPGLQAFQAMPGLPPGAAGAAGLAGMTCMTTLANPTGLPAGMGFIPAGLTAAAPAGATPGAQVQQIAAANYPYLGAYAGQQFIPQKLPGQNGLLQQAATLPVQGVAVGAAPSLKRPIADPYGVIDKRIRLAYSLSSLQAMPGLPPGPACAAELAGIPYMTSLAYPTRLPAGMEFIPAGLSAAAPAGSPPGAQVQQIAAPNYPYLGAFAGQQFIPQKLPGQDRSQQ